MSAQGIQINMINSGHCFSYVHGKTLDVVVFNGILNTIFPDDIDIALVMLISLIGRKEMYKSNLDKIVRRWSPFCNHKVCYGPCFNVRVYKYLRYVNAKWSLGMLYKLSGSLKVSGVPPLCMYIVLGVAKCSLTSRYEVFTVICFLTHGLSSLYCGFARPVCALINCWDVWE